MYAKYQVFGELVLPVAPRTTRPRDLLPSQTNKTIFFSRSPERVSDGACEGAEVGEESYPDGRGGGGDIADVRCIGIRPSEPAMAHNLAKIRTVMVRLDRVVDNIAL